MGYVIGGAIALGFLALIGHAGRDDDTTKSTARNVASQVLVVFAAAAVIGSIVWVATYGS